MVDTIDFFLMLNYAPQYFYLVREISFLCLSVGYVLLGQHLVPWNLGFTCFSVKNFPLRWWVLTIPSCCRSLLTLRWLWFWLLSWSVLERWLGLCQEFCSMVCRATCFLFLSPPTVLYGKVWFWLFGEFSCFSAVVSWAVDYYREGRLECHLWSSFSFLEDRLRGLL